MDHFLCCGSSYKAVRDAVIQLLLENRSGSLKTQLQVRETLELEGSAMYLIRWFSLRGHNLVLALSTHVKCVILYYLLMTTRGQIGLGDD